MHLKLYVAEFLGFRFWSLAVPSALSSFWMFLR